MIYGEDYTNDIDDSLKNIKYSNVYCCIQEMLTYFYRHTVFDFTIYGEPFTKIPLIKVYIGDLYLKQKKIDNFFKKNPRGSLICYCKIEPPRQQLVGIDTFEKDNKIMQNVISQYVGNITLNILSSAEGYTSQEGEYQAYDFASLLASDIMGIFTPHYYTTQAIREKYKVAFDVNPVVVDLSSLEPNGNIYRYNVKNGFRSYNETKSNKTLDKVENISIEYIINK